VLLQSFRGERRMSSTVFSLSLNELDMAKLGELQKKFPELSRNGMVRRIIHVMHMDEDLQTKDAREKQRLLLKEFVYGTDDFKTEGPYQEAYNRFMKRRQYK
jgi:hypothetical protein